jgi:hypothetical protein
MKSAVGQWSCRCQYWLHSLLEFRPGGCRLHLPYEAYAPGDSSELLAMTRRNTDCSVYQLVAKDFSDLHRHQVFRVTQVGPDKNLKMSILAALIIPTLTYPSAAPAAGREPNRNTQLGW